MSCEDCSGWEASVKDMDRYRMLAVRERDTAKEAAIQARITLSETLEGQERARLEAELKAMHRRALKAEGELALWELKASALPVPTEIVVNDIDILEGVQIMLDSLVSSMDAGSGFLDWRDWCAIRQVGRAIGVADLDKLTEGYGSYGKDQPNWPDPALPLTDEPRK